MIDLDDFVVFWVVVVDIKLLLKNDCVYFGGLLLLFCLFQYIVDECVVFYESLYGVISLQDRLEGGDEFNYLWNGLVSMVLCDLWCGCWVVQDEIDLYGLNCEEGR